MYNGSTQTTASETLEQHTVEVPKLQQVSETLEQRTVQVPKLQQVKP